MDEIKPEAGKRSPVRKRDGRTLFTFTVESVETAAAPCVEGRVGESVPGPAAPPRPPLPGITSPWLPDAGMRQAV